MRGNEMQIPKGTHVKKDTQVAKYLVPQLASVGVADVPLVVAVVMRLRSFVAPQP